MPEYSKNCEKHPFLAYFLYPLILLTISFCLYFPALSADFLYIDDYTYVSTNIKVHDGLTWSNILWTLTTFHYGNWCPLVWLSYMTDTTLFGTDAFGYHLTNLIFHCLNVVVIYFFLVILFRLFSIRNDIWAALITLLFTIHPLNVEPVTWISSRKDVLSAIFFHLSLISYISYRFSKQLRGRPASHFRCYYLMALLFTILGLMSKSVLVSIPFVLFLIEYLVADDSLLKCLKKSILALLPFLCLSIVFVCLTASLQTNGWVFFSDDKLSAPIRLTNAFVYIQKYFFNVFFPFKLDVYYTHPFDSYPLELRGLAISFTLLMSIYAWLRRRKSPLLAFGWFFFLVVIAPYLQINQVGIQPMADRWMYIPKLGLLLLLMPLITSGKLYKITALIFATYLAFMSFFITPTYLTYWRTSYELFEFLDAGKASLKSVDYQNLAGSYTWIRRWADSSRNYKKALEKDPLNFSALRALAELQAFIDKTAEVHPYVDRVVSFEPENLSEKMARIHCMFAISQDENLRAYYREKYGENPLEVTAKLYEDIISTGNQEISLYNEYASTLVLLDRLDEAEKYLNSAIEMDSDYAPNYVTKGQLLFKQKKYDDAIASYQLALEKKPVGAEIFSYLFRVYSAKNDFEEAKNALERAVEIEPKDVKYQKELGFYLLQNNHDKEAVDSFNLILADYPNDHRILALRGVAYAKLNRYQEALDDMGKSLTINWNQPDQYGNIAEIFRVNGYPKTAAEYYRISSALKALKKDTQNPTPADKISADNANDKAVPKITNNPDKTPSKGKKRQLKLNIPAVLFEAYKAMGDKESAEKAILKAIDQEPNNHIFLREFGLYLLSLEDYSRALEYLERALALNAKDYYALNYRGTTYAKLARYQEAVNDFAASLNIYPYQPDTLRNIAEVLRINNDPRRMEYLRLADAMENKISNSFKKKPDSITIK